MARFTITRTNIALPDPRGMEGASTLLFKALDGLGKDDRASWRRFWKRMIGMEPGEMVEFSMTFPRSGPFHRLHMSLEQRLFDMQEVFPDLNGLRVWLKIGSGWVIWAPGPDGGLIPIPKSISYASADEAEFRQFHEAVIRFLRGPHAALFLWPHLGERAHEQIEVILAGFGE